MTEQRSPPSTGNNTLAEPRGVEGRRPGIGEMRRQRQPRVRRRRHAVRRSASSERCGSRPAGRPPTAGRCGPPARSTARRRASTTDGVRRVRTATDVGRRAGRSGRCSGERSAAEPPLAGERSSLSIRIWRRSLAESGHEPPVLLSCDPSRRIRMTRDTRDRSEDRASRLTAAGREIRRS